MSLDFESQDFDPSAALSTTDLVLPCEDAPPLSTLASYYAATKGTGPKQTVKKSGNERKTTKAPTTSVFEVHHQSRVQKNVLTIMEEIQGPLGRLRQCMKERAQVKVWTRRANEIRGMCKGYILAFDRHWNLIMSDVDETYVLPKNLKTVPLSPCREPTASRPKPVLPVSYESEGPSSEQQAEEGSSSPPISHPVVIVSETQTAPSRRSNRAFQVGLQQRHINQIFVRGDNVAFISIV